MTNNLRLTIRLALAGAVVWTVTAGGWLVLSYLFLVLMDHAAVIEPVRIIFGGIFGGVLALGAAIFGTIEWRAANLRIRRDEARRYGAGQPA